MCAPLDSLLSPAPVLAELKAFVLHILCSFCAPLRQRRPVMGFRDVRKRRVDDPMHDQWGGGASDLLFQNRAPSSLLPLPIVFNGMFSTAMFRLQVFDNGLGREVELWINLPQVRDAHSTFPPTNPLQSPARPT